MKRKIIIVFLIVSALAGGSLFYLHKFILPSKLKEIIVEKISEFSGRSATLRSVNFSIVRGFIVEGLTIFDRDLAKPPLLSVDEMSFRVLYLPLFQERKIIVPGLHIKHPEINLTHNKDGSWDFSDILEKNKSRKPVKASFSVVVTGIVIDNAKLQFLDRSTAEELKRTFEDVNLKVRLALPKNVKFSLSGAIPATQSSLSFDGDYDFSLKKLATHASFQNLPFAKLLSSYYTFPNVLLDRGVIANSDIDVSLQDKAVKAEGKVELTNLTVKIEPDKTLQGNSFLDFTFAFDPRADKKISYRGFIAPRGMLLSGLPSVREIGNVNGKIYFEPDKLKTDNLNLTVCDTSLTVSAELSSFSRPQGNIRGTFDANLEALKDWIPAEFKKESGEASGFAHVSFDYEGPFVPLRPDRLKANILFENAAINHEKLPFPLSGINGRVRFENNQIALENLAAVAEESKITASGTIADLPRPNLDIRLNSSDFNLAKLGVFFPELLRKSHIKELSGSADVSLNYKGPAASVFSGKLDGKALFKNAGLKIAKLPDAITAINGKTDFSFNEIATENLSANFQNARYVLKGKIQNFKSPTIDMTLTSQDLNLTLKTKAAEGVCEISAFRGEYKHLPFDIKGQIDFLDEASPAADLAVMFQLDLKDAGMFFPDMKESLANLKPSGLCRFNSTVYGNIKNWQSLKISTTIDSDEVIVSGLHFNKPTLSFAQENEEITKGELLFDFYGGKFKGNLSADLAQDNLPLLADISLEKVNLALLKNDTPARDQDISGFLSATANLKGSLKSLSALEGEGFVLVSEGRIWQLNLLKGLGQFLFIPEFENITFNEAKGNFTVKNERVTTADLELLSPQASLGCAGWADFEGNLDLDIVAEFSEDMISQSDSLKKAITAILTQGEAYLTIKVTGTLKKPEYKLSPTGILKKTRKLIIEGLQSIFE